MTKPDPTQEKTAPTEDGPLAGIPCPGCHETSLDEIVDRNVVFVGCSDCYGLAVTDDDMALYVERAVGAKPAADAFRELLKTALGGSVAQAKRECWSCGESMSRFGFGESPFVIMDRCTRHGLWLDRSELNKVVRASRAYAAAEGWIPAFDDDD